MTYFVTDNQGQKFQVDGATQIEAQGDMVLFKSEKETLAVFDSPAAVVNPMNVRNM